MLSVDPANKHDVSVVREKFWVIVEEFSGCFLFLDKGYVSRELQEEFLKFGVVYTPVKRENQVSNLEEKKFYKYLSDFRRRIETLFSKFSEFLLRPSRSVSLRGLVGQDFRGDSGRESGQIIQLHRWWELGYCTFVIKTFSVVFNTLHPF